MKRVGGQNGGFFGKVIRYIKSRYQLICFINRNILYSRCLGNIPLNAMNDNIDIGGVSHSYLKECFAIYSYFNNDKRLNAAKRMIYFFISRKTIFYAKNRTTGQIVGIELYYFNRKDILEKTVHQGFSGVLPEWQGQGIGTMLRSHALNHFRANGFDGVSSRVSLNNLPSLKSNMKLGFKPVEKYFDQSMNEERYYLICPFNNDNKWKFIEGE
jgi:ribosomal protein S18 acetylase RimI-like enzyme